MDINGKKTLTDSPCIGICSTAFGDDVCRGCGRTFQEVIDWNTLDDDNKKAINLRLLKQRQAAESLPSASGADSGATSASVDVSSED